MSETSQGHGWWLASDGKWYPPEAWTGPPPQTGQAPYTATELPAGCQSATPYPTGYPSTGPPATGYPSTGPPSTGYSAAGYPSAGPYPAGYPPQGAPWSAARRTNGLAIASLACACAGIIPFLFGLPCLLGIIFGFVARVQIRNARGAQDGAGLALAGIIVGFGLIGLFILVIILLAIFDPSTKPVSAPAL
jgi:Domain of unknown function (DUF4190)